MGRRLPKITDREYWPAILERLESYAALDDSRTAAAAKIATEFGCEATTIYQTMQRGDVPSYPSTDPARARAWKEARTRYIRSLDCQKCGERVFSAVDGRCVNCDKAWVRQHLVERQIQLAATEGSSDFYTGRGLFAADKTFFEAQEQQEPFKRGSRLHAMASAMLVGATFDELAMITRWSPEVINGMFYGHLRPKGYGVRRIDGRYYILLGGSATALPMID